MAWSKYMISTLQLLPVTKKFSTSVIALCALLLASCNGGSSTTPDGGNVDKSAIVQVDSIFLVNQGVELALFYPEKDLTNINWQQTGGEPVTLLTKTSKVIAFTPSSAGNYSFEVNFSVNNSANQTLSYSITVDEQVNKLAARLGHTVLSDNKVSLRVFPHTSIDETSIQWQQTSGPNISFTQSNLEKENVNGDLAVFFTAPRVSKDTLLTFTVSATDHTQTYTDNVVVLVEPANEIANNAYFEERVAQVYPYNSNSPYAENLVACVYSNTLSSSCTLEKLPLLANEGTTPSIENIMNRVVVSHKWMGNRFKDFLTNSDTNNDFKRLLRATTAIVISYDVRPSFYWAATGAIYLDADNFWLTPEERDTINEAPDYRSDFGKELQFYMPWRYVKDNDYADSYFSNDQRVTRTINDGFYRLTSLLYHELAHANDFLPSSEWFKHNDNVRLLDAALSTNPSSDGLSVAFPLQSREMRNLAQVRYSGKAATTIEKSYSPNDIETFFSPDVASSFYAYFSEREDYALLFEELMMQSRFNVFRDVAVTNLPTGDNISASDYIVTWGQRGRIGNTNIKLRAEYSAARILTEFDSTEALSKVSAPVMMITGDDWLENLAISPDSNAINTEAKPKNRSSNQQNQFKRPISSSHYFHKSLPEQ